MAKTKRVNSIIERQDIDRHDKILEEHSAHFADIHDHLETMSRALSLQTQSHQAPTQGIPPVIQTAPSQASALTSDQTTQRMILEEHIRYDKDKQALM